MIFNVLILVLINYLWIIDFGFFGKSLFQIIMKHKVNFFCPLFELDN